MLTRDIEGLELMPMWMDGDSNARARFEFPLHAGHGTESTSVVYFEVEPGDYLARHTDSAEEILLVLAGEGVATVGDEEAEVGPGSLAVVPALEPHSVRATGTGTLKVVGFFSAATLQHEFDDPVQPVGLSHLVTPAAEVVV
jgi:quercetin dioxygenase-like cupin family protein